MNYYIRPLIIIVLCFFSAFIAQYFHDLDKEILSVFFTLFGSACGIIFFVVLEDSYNSYLEDSKSD